MAFLRLALLTIVAAQLLDLATFTVMIRQVGPTAEANPVVALIYTMYGLPTVVIAKLALVALVSAVALITARRPESRIPGIVIGAAIVAGLVGGLSNTIAIGAI